MGNGDEWGRGNWSLNPGSAARFACFLSPHTPLVMIINGYNWLPGGLPANVLLLIVTLDPFFRCASAFSSNLPLRCCRPKPGTTPSTTPT